MASISVFYYFLIATIVVIKIVIVPASNSDNINTVIDGLPSESDLIRFLTSLEEILNFSYTHLVYVDMNFAFGLHLMAQNLKPILEIKKKKLAQETVRRLNEIIEKHNRIIQYYLGQVENLKMKANVDVPWLDNAFEVIFSDAWTKVLRKLRPQLLKDIEDEQISMNTVFINYWENVAVDNNNTWRIERSSDCIAELAKTPENRGMRWIECRVSQKCRDFVLDDLDYGYFLTHRLLYLLLARYSRGCYIFSAHDHQRIIRQFCSKIYKEAEYLASSNYKLLDLLLEQSILCSLNGHAQFLQRSWLYATMKYQDPMGCVPSRQVIDDQQNKELNDYDLPKWEIGRINQEILGGKCNTHTTGLAAAVIGAAIRFILETYY